MPVSRQKIYLMDLTCAPVTNVSEPVTIPEHIFLSFDTSTWYIGRSKNLFYICFSLEVNLGDPPASVLDFAFEVPELKDETEIGLLLSRYN
ncbi:uncharacterized protein RSE6_01549 [Rhynchosporium secalis]|uniref:Uncharacterized protein n=1 Tax=Rhynchosporium secalis TaxID=38038 RepID=A0A1E1LY50_RHYSE|nr:uncharacterized protein RSE6_01549 [Rhynchosporium secalis]